MSDEPPTPQELPQIPRGKLWTSLLGPPLLIGALNAMIGVLGTGWDDHGVETSLLLLPIGLMMIICGLVSFIGGLRVRYHGRSVVLSGFGYLIGQVVICFAIWFGTCLVAFPTIH